MMMYTESVKRLQISIEEEMDDALAIEAARRRVSKAALIREFVQDRLRRRPALGDDSISALIGSVDVEPADIDEVVYGG